MRSRLRAAAAFLLVSVTGALPARAEDCSDESTTTPREQVGTITLDVENDMFGGTDRHYSNGIRATYTSPEQTCIGGIAGFLTETIPILPRNAVRRVGYTIGQNMYTPANIRRSDPILDDRPYAGWLYGGVLVTAEQREGHNYPTQLESLELDVGVVGPWSLAGQTQHIWHKTFGFTRPNGWRHQLDNEPGVILSYERKWRLGTPVREGFGIDGMPHFGVSLGNIYTHAAAGFGARIGYNLPDDFGPSGIRPSLPGTAFFRQDRVGFYLFAGVEGRAVGRNIFLDGNTFGGGQNVEKHIFVGDFQVGAAITFERFRLAYTQTFRTPEFVGQEQFDNFGAITLAFRW